MAADELTEEHAAAIQRLVRNAVLSRPLPPRQENEREPRYVARVLRPLIEHGLAQYSHLTCHGEGGRRAHEVQYYHGLTFVPDLSITYRQQRVLAVEAKFYGYAPQDAIAEALGQAAIYVAGGYLGSTAIVLGAAKLYIGHMIAHGPTGAPRRIDTLGVPFSARALDQGAVPA